MTKPSRIRRLSWALVLGAGVGAGTVPMPAAAQPLTVAALPVVLREVPPAKTPAKVVEPMATPMATLGEWQGQAEGQAYVAALPDSERADLDVDQVVLLGKQDAAKEGLAGFIRAVVIFEQSKEDTFTLMAEPFKLAEFLPRLDESHAVMQAPHQELTEFNINFLFWDITFRIQHWFYPELSRYEWALDSAFDNDIDDNRGYWQLYALSPRRTVGEYGIWVDSGIPLPQRLLEAIQRREIPDAMAAFKRYIDTGGKYRKN